MFISANSVKWCLKRVFYSVGKDVEKKEPQECKLVQQLWKRIWILSEKLKIEVP